MGMDMKGAEGRGKERSGKDGTGLVFKLALIQSGRERKGADWMETEGKGMDWFNF